MWPHTLVVLRPTRQDEGTQPNRIVSETLQELLPPQIELVLYHCKMLQTCFQKRRRVLRVCCDGLKIMPSLERSDTSDCDRSKTFDILSSGMLDLRE